MVRHTDTHTGKARVSHDICMGWPIHEPVHVWAAHIHMGCQYAYGLSIPIIMGQPISIWAEYLYGMEHSNKVTHYLTIIINIAILPKDS